MKHFFCFIIIVFLVACNTKESARVESTSTDSASQNSAASHFDASSLMAKANTFKPESDSTTSPLDVWGSDNLEGLKRQFGDPVTLNAVDSIFIASKPYRENVVSTRLHSWMPMKAAGKAEEWAWVWYTDYSTGADGQKDSTDYQEIWRLNKGSKATVSQVGIRKNPAPAKN
jgi:hypothetical protein